MTADQHEPECARKRDQRRRFVVWCVWAALLAAAAVAYAGKAAEDRSAFVRWRHQVHELWAGKNIWDAYVYPNPPILPLVLSPLMALPPVAGALVWFGIKAALASISVVVVLRWVWADRTSPPWWAEPVVLLLSLRPMLSDLQHGNVNLLILFLVVVGLAAWRGGRDVEAGLVLGLAASFKVTPVLFLPYCAVQRSWRTVAAGGIGIFLFLMVIPAVVLGPEFNQECLASWWRRFVSPYAAGDVLTDQEVNQSLIGVLARLLTESRDPVYGRLLDRNLTSWPAGTVAALAKLMSIGLVGLMLWLTSGPPRRRDHSERLGEFALVALTMLMVSERSWKHHFVTLLLPHAYLTYRLAVSPADRGRIAAVLSAAAALMATTSSELGGLFAGGLGHKIALYHGGFFWAAALLFAATAWQLRAERRAAAHGFGWSAAATSTVKPGSSTELAVWPGTNVPCST